MYTCHQGTIRYTHVYWRFILQYNSLKVQKICIIRSKNISNLTYVKPFLFKKTQARTHHAVKVLIPRAGNIVANSIFHNFFLPFSGLFHIRPHQIYKINRRKPHNSPYICWEKDNQQIQRSLTRKNDQNNIKGNKKYADSLMTLLVTKKEIDS